MTDSAVVYARLFRCSSTGKTRKQGDVLPLNGLRALTKLQDMLMRDVKGENEKIPKTATDGSQLCTEKKQTRDNCFGMACAL